MLAPRCFRRWSAPYSSEPSGTSLFSEPYPAPSRWFEMMVQKIDGVADGADDGAVGDGSKDGEADR